MAAERGLILVDTKYEFGTDADGNILIWRMRSTPPTAAATGSPLAMRPAFAAGTRPPSFDKDVIRAWVAARCDPYNDPIPEIPPR